MINYRKINHDVMTDTKRQYETQSALKEAIAFSVKHQYMVKHEDVLDALQLSAVKTKYVVSGKRTLEAAKGYKGKKVAVLNFANNHSIGGAPFAAGAQEESICRCSTLYPCLQEMYKDFYQRHRCLYEAGQINEMGNDDLIYTPGVVVFKTDELADVIYPKIMPEKDWYQVDVITSAAPELMKLLPYVPTDYEQQIASRIKKILDVAEKEQVEVLILGAWGCGAFKNPIEVISKIFYRLLQNYHFEVVEFALSSHDVTESQFTKLFIENSIQEEIIKLLKSTGRENIDNVISWMKENHFFEAPASVMYHNNCAGGLAKHSLDVYRKASELNEEIRLPQSSVIICSLLHDICKADQYYINSEGKPIRNEETCKKGHGRRSMFILKCKCQLPLNYDEEMAVWWHMGEYEKCKDHFTNEYEISKTIALCSLIQKADGIAANVPDSK